MSGIAITLIAASAVALSGSCPLTPSSDPAATSAIAGAPCLAEAPIGQPFAGEVLQVLDGRTICVAQGPTPQQWIKVTLADSAAGADRSALMSVAFARRVVCVASGADSDGVTGHCSLDGISLARASQVARR